MKYGVLLALSMLVPLSVLAQTTATVSDANNPNMERYCDPVVNADIFAKIKQYEGQMANLPENDPKSMPIRTEISKLTFKFKCSYRAKQQ